VEAKYNGIKDIAWHLLKDEGIRGFYKGIVPILVRGLPQRGIYFYFYELFKRNFIGSSS
jgi:hypothetical protein